MKPFKSVELFTGAGGLALGLEKSGWHHVALIERNEHACSTLHLNESLGHPLAKDWRLHSDDVRNIRYAQFGDGVDLVAAGPPCQPFSLGGKHRAYLDNRDMFAEAVRAVRELKPRYFIVENVKGLLRQSFTSYFNYMCCTCRTLMCRGERTRTGKASCHAWSAFIRAAKPKAYSIA